MINFRLTVGGEPPPPEEPHIFQVRKWGDPILSDLMGSSTEIIGKSNFQVVQLAAFNETNQVDFNAISKFQRVDYDFLEALQYEQDGPYGDVDQIMNWLVNHDGRGKRPYWIQDGEFRFGTMVFGGQLVQVETQNGAPKEYKKRGAYPGHANQEITFYRLQGLRREQMDEVWDGRISHSSHPWLIQHGTAANRPDKYVEFPRGAEIFHPVWDPRDWPCNYADGSLYISRDFLVT